jgi:2-hydroxychromene-2-carboxylate isomerase
MLVEHYFDYKSPYAYLAQADSFALAQRSGVELRLIPYTLDIPSYLGNARVDEQGVVLEESRNAHQWRRVRYSYMDCRREASRRGLTIRGPRKIFDSTIAHIGFLYACSDVDGQRAYHESVFRKFWLRELDIEDAKAVRAELAANGFAVQDFYDFVQSAGRTALNKLQSEAESNGVFGVPSYVLDGQLFWGNERFERVEEMIGDVHMG